MAEFNPVYCDTIPEGAKTWRRVVTGLKDGKSCIAIDEQACPHQMGVVGADGLAVTDIWKTGPYPSLDAAASDPCSRPLQFGPVEAGSLIQILEWPSDKQLFGTDDPAVSKAATAHASNTIDYVTVLSGEIYAVMDEGEVRLTAGDTLVQRGTRHSWSNRTDQPCYMVAVMLSGKR